MAMRDSDPRLRISNTARTVAAAVAAIIAVVAMSYNFGNQKSHSETYGTVTETEAQDGVAPSLAPDAGLESSAASEASTYR